jgi:hypothetical protein
LRVGANFFRPALAGSVKQQALKETFFPVCNVCTGRVPDSLLEYYSDNHSNKGVYFICYNCQQLMFNTPHITKTAVIRRIINSIRENYKSMNNLNRKTLSADEIDLMNYHLAQTYSLIYKDEQ